MLGMLEFMHYKAPTFECITLEFLSTIEFKLKKGWTVTMMYYGGTMHFRLYNVDHELTVEQLGISSAYPCMVPELFRIVLMLKLFG